MERHTIGGLKNILVNAKDFYEVQDYFLTLTETNMQAIEGKSGKNKVLKEIIIKALTHMCLQQGIIGKDDQTMVVSNMFMIEVRQRYFWHGSGFINGKFMFTFFYFADLDKGMIATAKGSNNLFARISSEGKTPKANPTQAFSQN